MQALRLRTLALLLALTIAPLVSLGALRADALLPGTPAGWTETAWGYVRSDFVAPAGEVPTILMMDGYSGASTPGDLGPGPGNTDSPTHYVRMADGTLIAVHLSPLTRIDGIPDDQAGAYWLAWASIRGTACSAGTLDLFDRVHAWDGHAIIEWLADLPWSMDKVALFGASYSGLTAFHIASTSPPSLAVMSANMVFDDLYRGITYPGGILNEGFPALWVFIYRPAADALGTLGGLEHQDQLCIQNQATRRAAPPMDHPILAYGRKTDDAWYASRSILTYASGIRVPTSISHAWQDEQTGPRGGVEMFNAISPDPVLNDGELVVPKRLITTNGVHDTALRTAISNARPWFDQFMLGVDTGVLDEVAETPVRLLFGTTNGAERFTYEADAELLVDAWPPTSTVWTREYLQRGGALAPSLPPADGGATPYFTGVPRQNWFYDEDEAGAEVTMAAGPDVLEFRGTPVLEAQAIAGPITATLHVTSALLDTDLFVSVWDEDADTGEATPLARGLLRASHRAVDPLRSLYNADGDIVRVWHPHTDPTPIVPGETYEYNVEVFPVAHVVHAGHRLLVRVSTPPVLDGLWGYDPLRVPGVNLVEHNAANPSSILVPLLPWPAGVDMPPEPACGVPNGYRCL